MKPPINQNAPVFGFTSKAPQRVNVLQNQIQISEAFIFTPQSQQSPVRKPYLAIWDTGATGTVITQKVIDELGLQPSGKVLMHVVGSTRETNSYLINLYLPNNVITTVKALEGSIVGSDALIGMDVIGQGDFAITNHNDKTTWTFRMPSCHEIDFVKEANSQKKSFSSPDDRAKRKQKRKQEKQSRQKNR